MGRSGRRYAKPRVARPAREETSLFAFDPGSKSSKFGFCRPLHQIERAQHRLADDAAPVQSIEHGDAVRSADHRLAVARDPTESPSGYPHSLETSPH
jgi:hypothetical protein